MFVTNPPFDTTVFDGEVHKRVVNTIGSPYDTGKKAEWFFYAVVLRSVTTNKTLYLINGPCILYFCDRLKTTLTFQQDKNNEIAKWRKRMRGDIEGELLNPEEHGRHFEGNREILCSLPHHIRYFCSFSGDIILFPEQAKEIYENALKAGSRRVKRKFIGSNLRRWDPTRPIIYSFDGSHSELLLILCFDFSFFFC